MYTAVPRTSVQPTNVPIYVDLLNLVPSCVSFIVLGKINGFRLLTYSCMYTVVSTISYACVDRTRARGAEQTLLSLLSLLGLAFLSPGFAALAKRMNETQIHMIALLLNYKRTTTLSSDMYFRNRAILAGRHASKCRWSVTWAAIVLAWNDHCRRATDAAMWHRSILNHQSPPLAGNQTPKLEQRDIEAYAHAPCPRQNCSPMVRMFRSCP